MKTRTILSILLVFVAAQLTFAGRYYDARIARWTTPDPALRDGDPQHQFKKYGNKLFEMSPYNYSFDNPIIFEDPDGHFPIGIALALAYLATNFSGDHPGGSPGLVQTTIGLSTIGASGKFVTAAKDVTRWALTNPLKATSITTGIAEGILPGAENLSPISSATKAGSEIVSDLMKGMEKFSSGQLKAFENQLSKDGIESLVKSKETFTRRLNEHVADLIKYEAEGGYTSVTKREIRNYQQQINAIDEIIGKQQ